MRGNGAVMALGMFIAALVAPMILVVGSATIGWAAVPAFVLIEGLGWYLIHEAC